jgi:leucyl aminopeptidase
LVTFISAESFDPTPSIAQLESVSIRVVSTRPEDVVLGLPLGPDGEPPSDLEFDWPALKAAGFEGNDGQTLVVPRQGDAPLVLVGIGGAEDRDAARLRDAAAFFARAAGSHAHLATTLADLASTPPADAAQVVVEGILLARYRYDILKEKPSVTPVEEITLVVGEGRVEEAVIGAQRGKAMAEATLVARDLANGPPALLTATRMAEAAIELGAQRGLEVEVFDKEALIEMECGGLLGVNAGSSEPPTMVKLTYQPDAPAASTLSLVGKGIMYDAGGIALKPADEVHATMKNDMSGAGAILAAMLNLSSLGCRNKVVAYLMCTDNRPSGTALAMGDVLRIRGGKTVEVTNTDAEGRLVMADALVLATEEPTDAIVDIATLTGAAMRALGTQVAAVIGNDAGLVDQIETAAKATNESVWELPLERRYRSQLNSDMADIKNLGGPNAGSITAALFLEEFVDGKPWAHIDIAGTAQNDADVSWRPPGCTGFGARLLVELALEFESTKA